MRVFNFDKVIITTYILQSRYFYPSESRSNGADTGLADLARARPFNSLPNAIHSLCSSLYSSNYKLISLEHRNVLIFSYPTTMDQIHGNKNTLSEKL